MASVPAWGKFHALFTVRVDDRPIAVKPSPRVGGVNIDAGVAIAMFVALVGWGGRYFGWSDPDGKIQLALVTAFILGIVGGFKARG